MRICTLIIAIALLSPSIAKAQPDEQELSLALEINRIQAVLNAAENQILRTNWLEPSEDQREALQELLKSKTAIREAMRNATQLPLSDRIQALKGVQASLQAVEGELRTEILLPHQLIPFDHQEFENLLFLHQGDYVKVVGTYYGKQFDLSVEQKKKLDSVKQKTSEKLEQLRVQFEIDKAGIGNDARKELAGIFTPEQVKFIEKVSGEKLVPEESRNRKIKSNKPD